MTGNVRFRQTRQSGQGATVEPDSSYDVLVDTVNANLYYRGLPSGNEYSIERFTFAGDKLEVRRATGAWDDRLTLSYE